MCEHTHTNIHKNMSGPDSIVTHDRMISKCSGDRPKTPTELGERGVHNGAQCTLSIAIPRAHS